MGTTVRRFAPLAIGIGGVTVLAALVWQAIVAKGAPDPAVANLSHGAVILNSAILVLREGLEAILVLAAITASFMGEQASYRKPVAAGAGAALLATVATWFIAIAVIGAVNAPALDVQAATGLLAIVVLLIIMNWFFHNVYWAGWIGNHTTRRRRILKGGNERAVVLRGLALLGFTAMYREGFEVVLFLQNLRLQAGNAVVLQGVGIGLFFTTIVGALTFIAHHKLPYKKMLVFTGIMLGFVLVVMVGESAQELQLAGWIPTTGLGFELPQWMGIWFAVFPTLESMAAQVIAALVVVGSYVVAEDVRVWRPRRRGEIAAHRPDHAPGMGVSATATTVAHR